jgi:hypothetical protein
MKKNQRHIHKQTRGARQGKVQSDYTSAPAPENLPANGLLVQEIQRRSPRSSTTIRVCSANDAMGCNAMRRDTLRYNVVMWYEML